MAPLKAKNVVFSGVMPGGHSSGSFEVEVENAYLMPPASLREGAWVVLYDDAHELFEGEILSVKPNVTGRVHKLSVELGGMMSVAQKRKDLSKMWVKRGGEGWAMAHGCNAAATYEFDKGVKISVPANTVCDFTSVTNPARQAICQWLLDDGLSDDTISYWNATASWHLTTSGGAFEWWLGTITGPSITPGYVVGWTEVTHQSNTNSSANYSGPLAAGAKGLCLVLPASAALTTNADIYVEFSPLTVYGSGRTVKSRIDQAMVDLAMRPGVAFSYTSMPVGPQMDDLRVGSGTSPTSVAGGLQELADYHAQPFDWGFWDNRSFFVRPRALTPDNDAQVIVVGGGRPGLVDWDVAEYDEDVPDYACVIFGNKDSGSYPEAWPRRIYRPTFPPYDNVKLETVDYSDRILSDTVAAAIGDNLVSQAAGSIPADYIFRFNPLFADRGQWQPVTTAVGDTVLEIGPSRMTGTVASANTAPTWGGSNSPADPSCLNLPAGPYLNFGNQSALNLGTGARSISAWVKFNSVGTVMHTIFNKSAAATTYQGYQLRTNNGNVLVAEVNQDYTGGYYRSVTGGTSLGTGVWHHAVAVYAGANGSWQLYLDGVVDALTTPGGATGSWLTDNTNSAAIGVSISQAANYIDGSVGEVLVYNRALTAAEVASIYAAGQIYYNRSFAKGTVVLEDMVQNRKGALVPASHVRAGWWIQHLEWGSGRPFYITGHAVNMTDKRNSLTIGQDWMEEELDARTAEVMAIAPTPEPEDTEEDGDRWKNWRVPGGPWGDWQQQTAPPVMPGGRIRRHKKKKHHKRK